MSQRLNFTLTQLEYTLAVQRYGHFAKAAENCHVSQPTLSMQIQKLEESLGAVLFDRSKKPILLTEMGEKLIPQMRSVVTEAKRLGEIIDQASSQELQGELKIGVIPTIAPYLLPKLLPQVEKDLPGLKLRIYEMQTQSIIAALNEDEINAGILAIPLKVPNMTEHSLYREPFSVVCRKNHPLATKSKLKYADLVFDDLWLLEEGHCLRNQVIDVCGLKKKLQRKSDQFQFESGSLETLKNLIDAYGGYTLLPALATGSIGKNSVLIPFAQPTPAREIGLIKRREHLKADLLSALRCQATFLDLASRTAGSLTFPE